MEFFKKTFLLNIIFAFLVLCVTSGSARFGRVSGSRGSRSIGSSGSSHSWGSSFGKTHSGSSSSSISSSHYPSHNPTYDWASSDSSYARQPAYNPTYGWSLSGASSISAARPVTHYDAPPPYSSVINPHSYSSIYGSGSKTHQSYLPSYGWSHPLHTSNGFISGSNNGFSNTGHGSNYGGSTGYPQVNSFGMFTPQVQSIQNFK